MTAADGLLWPEPVKNGGALGDAAAMAALVAPEPEQVKRVRVKACAVYTVPRQGYLEHAFCVMRELSARQITVIPAFGVFWYAGMERAFDEALKRGYDYIVAMDFDSPFVWRDVETLISALVVDESWDAMASFQLQRYSADLLAGIEGENKQVRVTRGKPFEVLTAHFGLTVLRAATLRRMAKPWFRDRLDEFGGYGSGRMDCDVAFWHNLRAAGMRVGIHPEARIGHIEEMVLMADENLKPIRVPVGEWRAKALGRGPGAGGAVPVVESDEGIRQ